MGVFGRVVCGRGELYCSGVWMSVFCFVCGLCWVYLGVMFVPCVGVVPMCLILPI